MATRSDVSHRLQTLSQGEVHSTAFKREAHSTAFIADTGSCWKGQMFLSFSTRLCVLVVLL